MQVTSDIVPYYFRRGEGRFESTVHVQGAWNPHEQHMAPVSGILAPGHAPGRGRVWLRTQHPLVDGVPFSDVARLIGLVDTSNGVATRVKPGPGSYLFPNLDLQIHLYREPSGAWLGLQNSVSFGPDGIGLTSTVLHDTVGPFGRAEQILTIRQS